MARGRRAGKPPAAKENRGAAQAGSPTARRGCHAWAAQGSTAAAEGRCGRWAEAVPPQLSPSSVVCPHLPSSGWSLSLFPSSPSPFFLIRAWVKTCPHGLQGQPGRALLSPGRPPSPLPCWNCLSCPGLSGVGVRRAEVSPALRSSCFRLRTLNIDESDHGHLGGKVDGF